jgi:exodeoxyribonuclease VII small subunit
MAENQTPTFEDALLRLDAIVHELEDGDLGLELSLARYEEGVKHLKACYQALEQAERRVELLTGVDADGNPVGQPFDAEAATPEEQIGRRTKRAKRGKECDPPEVPPLSVDEPPTLF